MKFCNVTQKEFNDVIASGKRMILWGAGKNASKCIAKLGIQDSIEYFVDNDSKKWGDQYENIDVYSPQKLENEKGILLVTPKRYFDILQEIWNKYDGMEVYCYEMMQTFRYDIDCLEDIWYYSRMIKPSLDRYIHNLADDGLTADAIAELAEKRGEELGTKVHDEYPLILPRMVLLVTEQCTLRCQGCCAFVDKFKSPQHMDINKLIAGMKKIFESIDGCINVQLGGGEALLYPQLKEILQYLIEEKKCEKIGIVTNGTVVPTDEILEVLATDKIFVEMSDYGLIDIQAKVIKKLEEHKVNFKVFCEQVWFDFGDPEVKLGKQMKQLKQEYYECPDGYMCKLFDGERIYACGRSLRMHHINVKDYDVEKDSCEINGDNLREDIKALYLQDYVEACDYCSRMAKPAVRIPVGLQQNESLCKSKYTIISREEIKKLREKEV